MKSIHDVIVVETNGINVIPLFLISIVRNKVNGNDELVSYQMALMRHCCFNLPLNFKFQAFPAANPDFYVTNCRGTLQRQTLEHIDCTCNKKQK